MRHPVSTLMLAGMDFRSGEVDGGVLRPAGLPCLQQHADPGAREDAVGAAGDGEAQALLAGPSEAGATGFAGGMCDETDAGLGGELVLGGEAFAHVAELSEGGGAAGPEAFEQSALLVGQRHALCHEVVTAADQGAECVDLVGGGHEGAQAVSVGAQDVCRAIGSMLGFDAVDDLAGLVDDADGVTGAAPIGPPKKRPVRISFDCARPTLARRSRGSPTDRRYGWQALALHALVRRYLPAPAARLSDACVGPCGPSSGERTSPSRRGLGPADTTRLRGSAAASPKVHQ